MPSSAVGPPQQKRQQQQHILVSWCHDSHVFFHSRTLVVLGSFLRALYNNIHHHLAFARELEEREKKTIRTNQQYVSFSFRCGIVYSRGNRTPESAKKQASVYAIKRKMKKKKLVYIPGTYISPFVVALAAGVNSKFSGRERFFLRTVNPTQDPNSCIHG